ncbi:MAG: alpha-glucan family phosphorylase [Dehalococcoidales bacterium]|nr:alpha-glucan family phosphorylase [Dehalococcoidales bacterium]
MTSPKLPERINRLDELANNLWWSWHENARTLFRALDYPLWRESGHNPIKELREVSQDTLHAAAVDRSFLALYDSVMSAFDVDMAAKNTWVANDCPNLRECPVAFFSMEYAIHNSLPIYAGGLGVLAGDICKEASDLGMSLIAVGFMYPQGYFHQHILPDGTQEEIYHQLDFGEAPVTRVLSPQGGVSVAKVELGEVVLDIGVWLVNVGGTSVYLMDTNLETNPVHHRALSARLYIADPELRLQQEIVLGIGGVRVLRALGIEPSIWHSNEGHTAFMMLERVREAVISGMNFVDAVRSVQAKTVFTTHTPALAGHDVFPAAMMERYFRHYWEALGIDREKFLQLGQRSSYDGQSFNMTALALRMANQRSGVSQLHEKVTRRMWRRLWPEATEDQVPISHVTNGVHAPSWIAREMCGLFDEYLGKDWMRDQDDSKMWEGVLSIPDEKLWAVRQRLKNKLVGAVRERMRSRWIEDDVPWSQVLAMGAFLNPEALTIAFVRRFAEYKRPALIFQDVERLKRIINNEYHPVQILFAGKSHPADLASKRLIQQVYNRATDHNWRGRIVFIEDYDIHIAHYLVHGVDVWLNVPRRLQEASGTSGMKAALNGVLNLSVRDGWWDEGFNGSNGWALGDGPEAISAEKEDAADAEALYRMLEEKIVPMYYSRDRSGVPDAWMRMVKESIRSIAPVFCTRRMLKEYAERMYRTAVQPRE